MAESGDAMAESGDEIDRYALDRNGTRFARASVEDEFLVAQYARSLGVRRGRWVAVMALALALLAWFAALVPEATLAWWPMLALTLAILAAIGLATSARRVVYAPVALIGSGLLLFLNVAFATANLPGSGVMLGLFAMLASFILSNTYFRPTHLALAVAPFLFFEVVAYGRANGTWGDAWGAAIVALGAAATGLVSARGAQTAARRAYTQERVIEAQRATIAQQREQLSKELSHQVAERSREIGAVLARSDAFLDVRALSRGERFATRYVIREALGAGGMGAVYEVERTTDAARLALKVVVGEVSSASAARFAREAEIGARVHHPNLVSIIDVGVATGVPYLVMELVRGGSLDAQRSKFGDVAWALPILRQLAAGLRALHAAGVVHRDLKPANVLLADGVPKISDFGISRLGALESAPVDGNADTVAPSTPRAAALTGTGVVMGTPLYMAPEAARSARALDARADIFAFGIIAYEMLVGTSPFAVPAFLLASAAQPLPSPSPIGDPRVAPTLARCVMNCLVAEPEARPTMSELIAALG